MTYLIQHRVTGHYLAERPDERGFLFGRSPNEEDAEEFETRADADQALYALREFKAAWMVVVRP